MATDLVASKVRAVTNALLVGVKLRVKGVPVVGETTLDYLNLKELEIQD